MQPVVRSLVEYITQETYDRIRPFYDEFLEHKERCQTIHSLIEEAVAEDTKFKLNADFPLPSVFATAILVAASDINMKEEPKIIDGSQEIFPEVKQ